MPNFNSMGDVKKHLEQLKELSALKPEDYALEEGGIANTIAKSGDMKFTQIRKFFSQIKRIETTELRKKKDTDPIDPTKLYMLMPELAYGVGRKVIDKEFYEVMKICLGGNKIQKVADFKRFVELLTAVIAYRKFETEKGGKK